jgi:hypothetical protein
LGVVLWMKLIRHDCRRRHQLAGAEAAGRVRVSPGAEPASKLMTNRTPKMPRSLQEKEE